LTIVHNGRTLVSEIDIVVEKGAVTALMGPSGSGKTLSARASMGQIHPDIALTGGSLKFPVRGDRDWFEGVVNGGPRAQAELLHESAALRGPYVSYSPQMASSALNPGRTLGRQLEMAIMRRTNPTNSIAMSVRRSLDEVGLPYHASRALPIELSGGMCQRAALAVAVASHPQLVIADEPETGLDPVLTRGITELLIKVCNERKCGLLLISHQDQTVAKIGASIIRLPGVEVG
jgi:peptide/nickel transport system ATP-binding protein